MHYSKNFSWISNYKIEIFKNSKYKNKINDYLSTACFKKMLTKY